MRSHTICELLAMSVYMGSLMGMGAAAAASCIGICFGYLQLPVLFFTVMAILIWLPLDSPLLCWGKQFTKFAVNTLAVRTSFKVVYEDENVFSRDKPSVVGYEPHSVFPFGLSQVFSDAGSSRADLKSIHNLVTSMVGWCPILRHLFHWLNAAEASRANVHRILNEGGSVVLVPGGVAELAYMEPGRDVVFLKSRTGFVKIALQHGVPIVPAYCFGQNDLFKFIRLWPPFLPQALYNKMIRTILFCPMLIYGQYGTPLPCKVQMYMVIGKPIALPHIEEPSREEVQRYLDLFIEAMQGIYQRHQTAAGSPESVLCIM